MATLYVTEYAAMALSFGGGGIPIAQEPPVASQTLRDGGGNAFTGFNSLS
jgi:hypothetical protein